MVCRALRNLPRHCGIPPWRPFVRIATPLHLAPQTFAWPRFARRPAAPVRHERRRRRLPDNVSFSILSARLHIFHDSIHEIGPVPSNNHSSLDVFSTYHPRPSQLHQPCAARRRRRRSHLCLWLHMPQFSDHGLGLRWAGAPSRKRRHGRAPVDG